MDLGAALAQHQTQIGGLGLQMDGDGDGQTGKGLLAAEALLNAAQGGHKVPHPLDLLPAGGGQRHIFYNAHILIPPGSILVISAYCTIPDSTKKALSCTPMEKLTVHP
jgi:hypothetical protein